MSPHQYSPHPLVLSPSFFWCRERKEEQGKRKDVLKRKVLAGKRRWWFSFPMKPETRKGRELSGIGDPLRLEDHG